MTSVTCVQRKTYFPRRSSPQRLNRLRIEFLAHRSLTSAAKTGPGNSPLIAAVNRCATQNQPRGAASSPPKINPRGSESSIRRDARLARPAGRGRPALHLTYTSFVFDKGNSRTRLPVAANTALYSAGAKGGTPGSPTPAGGASLFTICTSTWRGARFMRAS